MSYTYLVNYHRTTHMKEAESPKTVYYTDELNDEFSSAKIKTKKIGDDYKYIHTSVFKKITHFFWYRIVMTPIAFLYLKLKFHHQIINRQLLKGKKKESYFLIGNHTQATADAYIPSFLAFPKNCYCIVHANNVSMPVLGKITPSLGALPLPATLKATRNFLSAIKTRVNENKAIVIYPEAHIWPYCTFIRPFKSNAFHYPVSLNKPVYCFTNTYQKRKNGKVKIVTYIDGPFYPDNNLDNVDAKEKLRDEVYETMCKEALHNTVEVIHYERKKDNG